MSFSSFFQNILLATIPAVATVNNEPASWLFFANIATIASAIVMMYIIVLKFPIPPNIQNPLEALP